MVAPILGSGKKMTRRKHADSLSYHYSKCWLASLRNMGAGAWISKKSMLTKIIPNYLQDFCFFELAIAIINSKGKLYFGG